MLSFIYKSGKTFDLRSCFDPRKINNKFSLFICCCHKMYMISVEVLNETDINY